MPDEIVAVVPKPWARDSTGRPVATNLTISGSTLTMAVDHRQAAPAYPVIAASEAVVANSLDEWEAQTAVAASYADEEPPDRARDPAP